MEAIARHRELHDVAASLADTSSFTIEEAWDRLSEDDLHDDPGVSSLCGT